MPVILEVILKGLGFGLLLAVLIGPVFFAVLQTTLNNNFRSGVAVATGIIIADLLFVILAYWSTAKILKDPEIQLFLGLAGGIFAISFGISLWFKKTRFHKPEPVTKGTMLHSMGKGFLINGMNPFVLIYWIGVIGGIGNQYDYQKIYMVPFVATCLFTVFSTDVIKIFFASRIRQFLTAKVVHRFNYMTGTIFLGFGLYLLGYVIFHL